MRRLPRHRRAPGRDLGKPAAHGGRVMPATGRLGRSPELRRRPVRPNRALSSWARSEEARARTWRRGGGAPGAPDRGVGPRLAGTTGPGAAGRGRRAPPPEGLTWLGHPDPAPSPRAHAGGPRVGAGRALDGPGSREDRGRRCSRRNAEASAGPRSRGPPRTPRPRPAAAAQPRDPVPDLPRWAVLSAHKGEHSYFSFPGGAGLAPAPSPSPGDPPPQPGRAENRAPPARPLCLAFL